MLKEILTKSFKMHVYNMSRQYSELKHLKANLKEDEIILSVDFSKNYDNKQHHEIQSAYFGHVAFTLYTAACYCRSHDIDGACVDKDTGLKVLSLKKTNFMAPFYGWGSTASRIEPLRGGSLLFTTKFPVTFCCYCF